MNSVSTEQPVGVRRRISDWKRRLLGQEDVNMRAARQHRSLDAMSGVLGWMLGLAEGELGKRSWTGRALEIGTGQFMAHAAGLYVCGFDRVVTVDRYRQVNPALVRASLANPVLARRFLSPFVSHDQFMTRWRELEAKGFCPERMTGLGLEYKAPVEASALAGEAERFDLIFSYTVMEHVPPVELSGLLAATSGLLAPGGVALHFVDLEDHLDPRGAPFAFLEPSGKWTEDQCGERGNRMRIAEWKRLLPSATGLNWRFPYVAVRHDAALPAKIDPLVANEGEDDLRTTAFVAMTQAPESRVD